MRTLLIPLVLAFAVVSAQAATTRIEAAGLRLAVPAEWVRTPAPSDMRAAQYRVPDPKGAEDAEFVLFFFGKGQGGGVEQNLQRWYQQFTRPDGKPSKDTATITVRTIGKLKVTTVDLVGTYKPAPMGGGGGATKPNYRMLASVIEGEGGPWFLRLVGPEATVTAAKEQYDAVAASVEPHQ